MPLHIEHGEAESVVPCVPAPIPSDTCQLADHDKVWVVRITGEMYKTYSEYIARVAELRRPVYECSLTGRSGLRYEETLLGSRLAEERLSSFPHERTSALLTHIHGSSATLTDLINSAHKLLGGFVAKQLIKLKIKQSTSRANGRSPWIVHEKLRKEYSIADKPLSEESQERSKPGKPMRRRPGGLQPEDEASDKIPVEDTCIRDYDKSEPPSICEAPTWAIDSDFEIFKDLYMSWSFLNRFNKEVGVSKFSFLDWIDAVSAPKSSRIYPEVIDSLIHLLLAGEPHFGPIDPEVSNMNQLIRIIETYHQELRELTGTGLRYIDELIHLQSFQGLWAANPTIRAFIIRQLCDQSLCTEHIRMAIDNDVLVRQELKQSQKLQLSDEKKELKKQRALIRQEKAMLAQSKTVDVFEALKLSIQEKNVEGTVKSRQMLIAEQKALKAAQNEQRARELEQMKAESHVRFLEAKYEAAVKDSGRSSQCTFLMSMLQLQVRCTALGLDRYHNEYYWVPEAQGTMVVIRPRDNTWGWYDSPTQIDTLCQFLSEKGIREASFLEKLNILREPIIHELQAEYERKNVDILTIRPVKRKTRAAREEEQSDEGWINKYRRIP